MVRIVHRRSLATLLFSFLLLPVGSQLAVAQEEGEPAAATPAAKEAAKETVKETVAAPDEQAKPEGNVVVLMKTLMGDIKIRLLRDKAPISVANFLSYVDEEFYDGTVFHRVIRDFMIQGGGFTAELTKKETKPAIKNEADNGLSNKRGTIAMARTNITDSATSQFFINVVDNKQLDYRNPDDFGYAVFGEVIEGMDVVDKIRAVKTGARAPFTVDCPLAAVTIVSLRRVEG